METIEHHKNNAAFEEVKEEHAPQNDRKAPTMPKQYKYSTNASEAVLTLQNYQRLHTEL